MGVRVCLSVGETERKGGSQGKSALENDNQLVKENGGHKKWSALYQTHEPFMAFFL